MKYFIPDWQQSGIKWKDDRTLNLIKLFVENDVDYQLILIHYLPFLRYKAMEHSIYPKNYWRLYDTLQNIHQKNGHPISLEELEFPDDLEEVYTPHGLLLLRDGELKGDVSFNEFAFVSQMVDRFKDIKGYYINYYDDRGFRSSRQYITDKNYIGRIDYFNEFGEITLIEYFGDEERVVVTENGNPAFKQKEYPNMQALIIEALKLKFKDFNSKTDSLITVTDEEVMNMTENLQQEHRLIRIFNDDQNIESFNEDALKKMITESLCLVTDSERKKTELEVFLKTKELAREIKVVNIPLYTTDLALGVSNSVAYLTVYWRANQMFEDIVVAHKQLIKKMIKNAQLALVIEIDDEIYQGAFEDAQKDIVDSYYGIDSTSDDFINTASYLYSKKIKKVYKEQKKAVEKLKETDQWPKLVAAAELYERIQFSVSPKLTQLKRDLQRARVYLDLNEKNDLKTHALAISTGIPMILKTASDYLVEGKNGALLKKNSELSEVLDFYLFNLDNWNKVLVEDVQLIDEFGSEATMEKWRRIFNDPINSQVY